MALNVSLVLSGDGEGAERALRGVSEELARGEKGAEAYNRAYATTDASIKKLATAQAAAQRETAQTTAAYKAGEISLEQYNRELLQTKTALGLVEAEHRETVVALNQANRALGQAPGQTGAARAGYAQLGAQMQDVAVMAQGGANIGTIIATQGGQVASAVQMMGGRFSGLAGFIAGPWGAAVLVGASVLGNLVSQLFATEDAAASAEAKTFDFADGLDILRLSALDAADAMKQLSSDMQAAIAVQGNFLRQNALVAQTSVSSLQQRLANDREELAGLRRERSGIGNFLPSLFGPSGQDLRRERELTQRIAADRSALKPAMDALELSQIAVAQSRVNEQLDVGAAVTGRYERAVGELNKRFRDANDDPLDNLSLTPAQYEAEFKRLTQTRDAELAAARAENRTGGRNANSSGRGGGSSPIDRQARELQRLSEYGDRTAESIARISERFGEQPSLVVQVNQAMRELDGTLADLTDKSRQQPANVAELIAQASMAKTVVQDALVRPFTELREESERRQQVDLLLLAGKREQAAVVQEIWRLEERLGPLSAEQRAEVEAIVVAEQQHLELLEKAQENQLAYLDATRGVRSELEAMLAGRGDLGNFKQIYRDLKARVMVEQIFGPALQELEDYVTQNTALPDAVNVMAGETARAGSAAGLFADVLVNEAQRIANPAASSGSGAFQAAFAGYGNTAADLRDVPAPEIVVTAVPRPELSPEQYFERMAITITAPLLEGLNEIFGVEFFSQLQGAVATAFYGYATAGTTGGVLGFAKGLVESQIGDEANAKNLALLGLRESLGQAITGAQRGSQVAGMAGMFGLNMSNGGAQLGGALGSFLPIPGGDILGALAGGVLGKLVGGSKRGSAIVTGADGGLSTYGNSSSRRDAALSLGGSVQEGVRSIAEALGAELGSFLVSIGIRNDDFRVDTSGRGYTKSSIAGVRDFGQDEAGAIAFAIADAIADGAIKGISPAVERALKSGGDIDKAVKDALAVADLEDLIGYIGREWQRELIEFEELARERVDLARRYGVDLVKVEELNAKERLALTEQLLEEQVGSLQELVDQMTSGNLFEGSAVDRRNALLDDIAGARVAAQAGEAGAADRLAGLLRQLNEVSAEVFGSTGGFAADRTTILDSARDVIAAANQRIEDAKNASDPALAQTNAALDENNDQNAEIIALLGNLATAIQSFAGGGGGGFSLDVSPLAGLARTSG